MTTEQTTSGDTQPRDPGCFEQWLCERLRERRDRQDEVGRVARWVLRENKEGRWPPEDILLKRNGHAYDVPAHYERVLKYCANQNEEDIETFFRVYDLYLKDALAEYDGKVEERSRKVGEGSGGRGAGSDEKSAVETSGDGPKDLSSSESWTKFFYQLHGPEGLGYEIDEDGYPIDEEPYGGIEGH